MGIFFKTYGILGQNSRNLDYIKGHNGPVAKKLADSKLKTKDFLKSKGVGVPATINVLSKHDEINDELFSALKPPFVIKPSGGFGGKGIIVIEKKDSVGNYISNSNIAYSKEKIKSHLSDIIDGFFSLSGFKDKVIIEKKIVLDHEIDLLGKFGLPDIRIIVFNMVPVMAMLRVPTKESDGKGNLHAGACGVGIDIGTGKLTYILHKGEIVKTIEGIGDVRGIKIPHWKDSLNLAVAVQQVTGIGFLGCDIVLDEDDGPLLLEMNIRPGIEIQYVNMAPLKTRLNKVAGVAINSIEKGVRLGRDLFSGDIEEKIKNISGKKVLGIKEYFNIEYKDKEYKYICEIKASRIENAINKDFVKNILKLEDDEIDSGHIKLKGSLLGEKQFFKFKIKDNIDANIIIGIKSLRGFLIDPFKYRKGELPVSEDMDFVKGKNVAIKKTFEEQIIKIDKELIGIDKKLLILKYTTPKNIVEEKQKFKESKGEYIPHFKYNEIKLDFESLKKKVDNIEIRDIPLSEIYNNKKVEVINKIGFLNSFVNKNYKDMTNFSKRIYGEIDKNNIEYCKEILENRKKIIKEEEFMNFTDIRTYINKFNHIYNIKLKLKQADKTSRFVMKGDIVFLRKGSTVGKKEMRSVIAHEIEGHYLRKLNGKKLKYSIFASGSGGYLEIDEGIAIYNQNRFLTDTDRKFYGIYERYYMLNFALNNNYKKLLTKMIELGGDDYDSIFNNIARLKRGLGDISEPGVFTKDSVYVNGFLKVQNFLNSGGNLRDLYIGKVSINDLKELKDSYFIKVDFADIKTPFFL